MIVIREFGQRNTNVGCIKQFGHVSSLNYFYRRSVEGGLEEEI